MNSNFGCGGGFLVAIRETKRRYGDAGALNCCLWAWACTWVSIAIKDGPLGLNFGLGRLGTVEAQEAQFILFISFIFYFFAFFSSPDLLSFFFPVALHLFFLFESKSSNAKGERPET
jgi:hypothetical protein